jgi:hypothetical protein
MNLTRRFRFQSPRTWRYAIGATVLVAAALLRPHAASVVKINRTADGWELLRNGQPYLVQGAGG